jgi:hypothetical protein
VIILTEKKTAHICINCGKVIDEKLKPHLIAEYQAPQGQQVEASVCKLCVITPFFTKDRLIQKIFKSLGEMVNKG